MPGPLLTGSFTISVSGAALPAGLEQVLVSATVEHSLNLPDVVALRFRDPDRTFLAAAGIAIGAPLTVSVAGPDDAAPQVLIEAEVTALEAEFDATGTFTVVRGYDASHRLFRGRRTETYTQLTASDAARKVASRAGLGVGVIEATSTVFAHLSQAGVSDWQFLDALAREIGYEVCVRAGKLDFRKPRAASDAPAVGGDPGPLVLQQGYNLLRFRAVVTSADQVKDVQVRGWDVARKQALIGVAPAHTNSALLPTTSPAQLAHLFRDPSYLATDVPYGSQAEVDTAATALADQIAGAFAELEGVARGNPKLRARAAVAVDGLGAPFDGKYVVTTSRHSYDPATGYVTHFAITGKQERSLLGLASGGIGAGRGMPGVVIGQVTDVKDPQGQARVKLMFPWLSDSYVSDWARTVQPGAGHDRGAMLMPEVGDEVLVTFEQGDIRRPYVIGGLYNGVDTPPTAGIGVVDGASGAINRRSLVSRRGHRIDLLDQQGSAEGIVLRTGDNALSLVLDATGTSVTVHSDGQVVIEAKSGVRVDAGNSSIDLSGQNISLTARSGVTIDGGGGAVNLTAGTELSLTGTTAKLEGSAQTEVKGGASCAISAALVRIN